MAEGDVQAVAALEALSFPTPWKPRTFHRLLANPSVETWVATAADGIVAYAILWCVLDQAELANIAVAPDHRGKGIGGRLLDHALAVGRRRGVRTVFLEVRPSNTGARRLYEARGFQEVGRRPDYYQEPVEDALVLRLELAGDDPAAPALERGGDRVTDPGEDGGGGAGGVGARDGGWTE